MSNILGKGIDERPLHISKNEEDGFRSFTIVRCTGEEYSFCPLESYEDFGHIIKVEYIVSCSYDHDDSTRLISAKFKAYQSAINNVYNEDFIRAVDTIVNDVKNHQFDMSKEDKTSIAAIIKPSSVAFNLYLKEVVKIINTWSPSHLESIITELFAKNGYEKIGNNKYDRQGGDIDIIFNSTIGNTLLSDIFSFSNSVDAPEIRVQAKKKWGIDSDDIVGVRQLLQMDKENRAINIVINTTEEFSEEAKILANKNVILINGRQFAALLVKYGIDITELITERY